MKALLSWALLAFSIGCQHHPAALDAAATIDAASDQNDLSLSLDGNGFLSGAFSILHCASLESVGGQLRCSGPAPLTITFVPFGSNLRSYSWAFPSGTPASSDALSPTVTFFSPGTYSSTLVAVGPAGAV